MDDLTKRRREALEGDDVSRELERILAAVKRAPTRWRVVVVVGMMGMGGAGVAYKVIPARYESETVFVYREGIKTAEEKVTADRLRNLSSTVKEALLSTNVVLPVVRDFNLFKDTWDGEDLADAVAEAREAITYEKRAEDTFSVTYKGYSAEEARDVTQRLAIGVGEEISRVLREQAQAKYDFLEAERKQRAIELGALEEKRAAFMVQNPQFAKDTQAATSPGATIRKTEETATGTGVSVDKNQEKIVQSEKTAMDQELSKSRGVLTDKQRTLAELRQKYTDKHPEVRAAVDAVRVAEVEVATKQAQADEALAKLQAVQSGAAPPPPKTDDPYASAEAVVPKVAALAPKAAPTSSALVGQEIVSAETEWAMLNRDIGEAKKRFDGASDDAFSAKVKIASASAGYAGSFEIVTPAVLPTEPNKPSPTILAAGVAAVGWLLGVFLAAALSVIDDRLFLGSDLQRLLEVVAVVPKAEKPKGKLAQWLDTRLAFVGRLRAKLRRGLSFGRAREPARD